MNRVLIRGARQLLTLAGPPGLRRGAAMHSLNVISDGAVLIRDGVIEQVGPSRRVERLAEAQQAAEEIDATGRVVLPAFIDCYTRLTCGPFRAVTASREAAAEASQRALRGWSAQRVELEARRRLRQFLRHGSATVASVSGDGGDLELDLRSLRVLDRLRGAGLTALVPLLAARAASPEAAETLATEVLPMLHARRLAAGLAVDVAGWPAESLEGLVACGERLGLPSVLFQTTSSESVIEACRLRALAAILESADSDAIAALAAAPATAALLLPAQSFYSSGGDFAPARALIDAGAGVALATGFDTIASPTVSLPAVMAIACARMGLTADEALTAVTVNAAHVLGLGSSIGALQYGMRADLLIADCGDYREIPLYFGMNPVALVIRGGRVVFPRVESVAAAD